MRSCLKHLGYAGLLVLLGGAPLRAVAFHNGPIDGQVIDAVTKQPIAGAFVVAKWERVEGLITDGAHVCRHIATVVSDAQGRYHIDAWAGVPNLVVGWLTDSLYDVSLDAYKPGMEIVRPAVFKMSEMTGTLVLTAWTGTRADRLFRLSAMITTSDELDCMGAEVSGLLEAAREAVYAEAKAIATASEEDQKIIQRVDSIRRFRDSLKPRGRNQTTPAPTAPSQ